MLFRSRVWIQFLNAEEYQLQEKKLFEALADSDGQDQVVIILKDTKQWKTLPDNRNVLANDELQEKLNEIFGKENVKFVTKAIEKQ